MHGNRLVTLEAHAPSPINEGPVAILDRRLMEGKEGQQEQQQQQEQQEQQQNLGKVGQQEMKEDVVVVVVPAVVSSRKRELNGPGLLGQDIIPLSGLVTPHHHHITTTPIITDPEPSREVETATIVSSDPPSNHQYQQQHHLQNILPNMIFSDLYKSPRSPFNKLRNSISHQQPPLTSDIDADLVSKDKAKAKEAVKKYLEEKVKNDWEFEWPSVITVTPVKDFNQDDPTAPKAETSETTAPLADGPTPSTVANDDDHDDAAAAAAKDSGEEAESESDSESVYSTISEDPLHFQPRLEWTSDLSDDDEPFPKAASPFRFDSPDDVGTAVRTSIETKRAKRRRALREEATWNPGLACFEARRDAWTGAKTVRVKPKPPSPVSPSSTRRIFWRHHRSESSASQTAPVAASPPPVSPLDQAVRTSQQTDMSALTPPISETESSGGVQRTSSNESTQPHVLYPVQTVVPVPEPLLPPQNAMRSQIVPSIYPSLYDKLVVQGLTPACPVNLSDMIRACVVGWKRDGEWPPKSMYPPPPVAVPSAAELAAARQKKIQQQQQERRKAEAAAKKAAAAAAAASQNTTTASSTVRRLSFGFLGGSKPVERVTSHEEKEHHSNSDETGGSGGAGKAFRRSLQRVLSLGHGSSSSTHTHHGGPGSQHVVAAATVVSGTNKEATAAGMAAALV